MLDLGVSVLLLITALILVVLSALYRRISGVIHQYHHSFGIASLQGARRHMEDAYAYDFDLCEDGGQFILLAIFDGHGGPYCSTFCAQQLPLRLRRALRTPSAADDPTSIKRHLLETIAELDDEYVAQSNGDGCEDGTTAAVVLLHVRNGVDLYVCNVGDSRTVLVHDGIGIALSDDHKPDRADELRRIEQAGGYVTYAGTWRVQGILSVSRSIGDGYLKPMVTAEPEITTRRLVKGDDFLIVACDGLWDTLPIQTAANIVQQYGSKPNYTAGFLAEMAIGCGSTDNVTCIVLNLQKFT